MAQNRLVILSQCEIDDLYKRPEFTANEQQRYFELQGKEQELLTLPISDAALIDAILQLGYLKAKGQFFNVQLSDPLHDVNYLLERYKHNQPLDKITLNRKTRYKNQQRVLAYLGYTTYTKEKHFCLLLEKAQKVCQSSVDPVLIFRELLEVITTQKITLPAYTILQTLISKALSFEQERIAGVLKQHLRSEEEQHIVALLQNENSLYPLTVLKQLPKNFSHTATYQEIAHYKEYFSLHRATKKILPQLKISKNSISYYASLAEHYPPHKLRRLRKETVYLWIICYIHHRYQKIVDNLATLFIHFVARHKEESTEKVRAHLLEEALKDKHQDSKVARLLHLYIDETIDDGQSFQTIKEQAFAILPAEHIKHISAQLEQNATDYQNQLLWEIMDKTASKYKPILRALFKVLPFESQEHLELMEAIGFLKASFSKEKSLSTINEKNFPKEFIKKTEKPFIQQTETQKIYPNRYEFYTYQQVQKQLIANTLYLTESLKFQSLSAELVPDWKDNKRNILQKIDKPTLYLPLDDILQEKGRALDNKIMAVNEAIKAGANPYLKIHTTKAGKKSWTLPYNKKEDEVDNTFYQSLPSTNIIDVLIFTNQQVNFVQQFTPLKRHYAKAQQDVFAIFACLIANATNLGVYKMAGISDIPYNTLSTIDNNFIRLHTLREANNSICNAIASLPLFKEWNLQERVLHAGIDGQKFTTEQETFLARYSSKYFGLDKGVVAYTMVANHVPVNAQIIGANEYEGNYLFDLVYNNTSEIQPSVFSTDTAGTNQLNFLLLYYIGCLFAPRYRSLSHKTESIICFSEPDVFKDYFIKPKRQFNAQLVLDEEDNIKHILASLLLRETQQNTIISKLSSQYSASRTKKALWEFNALLMSDYLLDYIHNVVWRQVVQGALNRVEAYHQMRKYISIVNNKQFRGATESEISVWNECARLVANAIIYYNAILLTKMIAYYESRGLKEEADKIKRFSPVAWQHINFYGQYQFLNINDLIDVDRIIQEVMKNSFKDR